MKHRAKLIIAISASAGITRLAAQEAMGGLGIDTTVPFSGHPLGNIGAMPVVYKIHATDPTPTTIYEYHDPRFNAQPEKSTFTPKIHNKSKRW